MKVPFNQPFLTGKETHYIEDAVNKLKLSGNGTYTKKCQQFFEDHFKIDKALLTTSCTDAIEMAALLLNIKEGDEVIMPSFTFVSTANAFVLRGAKIVFCDSRSDHPGMDEDSIEALITKRTKAIVPVHYAGVACDMEKIMSLAQKYNLFVVEDAAQAINSYYTFSNGNKMALGSIGDLGAFSFHETKNIISGEGGLLAINNPRFKERAEIIWEKGTNRSAFFRGEIAKYGWVDIGSSFLPSEITAAFLWAQLENLNKIQKRRLEKWSFYQKHLSDQSFKTPIIPQYADNNAHIFYIICEKSRQRDSLIEYLKSKEINAVFHYLPLHKSHFYLASNPLKEMKYVDFYSKHLVRLPLYYELDPKKQKRVINEVLAFFNVNSKL